MPITFKWYSTLHNYIDQQMNEGLIEDNLSLLSLNQHSNPELVSIRKRLIAPNNLLPSKMIRSQSPVHILPVQRDFQSQAGHQMLLDSLQQQSQSQNDRLTSSPSNNILMRHGTIRAESNLKQRKRKQNLNLIQLSKRQITSKQIVPDILQFLNTSIRSILNYPQNIIFVSKTAILNNQLLPQFRRITQTDRLSNQQKKKLYINWLKQNPYYGTVPYAFDHLKQQQISSMPSYPNTDQYLEFDDNFQSSNIYLAMRCNEQLMNMHKKEKEIHSHLYFLNLRLDYNTKSYGQWFYFKVKRKQSTFSFSRHGNNYFKFMIINMTKNSSLFGKGLKISVCRAGVWNKEGINIRYFKNSLKRQDASIIEAAGNDQSLMINTKHQQTYCTLEFTLQISQGQQIYISYNEPYTFSRLGKFLDNLTQRYQRNKGNIIEFKRSVLCNTYLRNNIEVLTFTVNQTKQYQEAEKKIIFLMARTHPVETAGSHVVEGILNQLLQLFIDNTNQAQKNHPIYGLLQNFVIKIIPMTNPDGVILGNSRCNIAGYDLNRSWKFPGLQKSKEVYFIKNYIMEYQRRIEMFIDLHAHSKKKNVFAYGCHDFSNPYSTRQFPYLLSKLSANDFLFQQCRFTKINQWKDNSRRKKNKEGTARVFVYDTLKIPNVFTIQNSYCSAKNSLFHYDKSSYKVIGADILKAISLYFSPQFKKNSWAQTSHTVEVEKNQINRFSNQSRVQVSLDNTYTDFQLTFTINSSVKQGHRIVMQAQSSSEPIHYSDIRSKYLKELHQETSNISIGLLQDDPSESEEQKRLYDTKTNNKQKIKTEPSISKGKTARTQRVISFLNRNAPTPPVQTSLSNNFSNLQFSNHNSQTSLAKITKITNLNKDRCYTVNKQILFVEDQGEQQEQKARKEKYLIKRGLKQKKKQQTVESQQIKIVKKDKFLSVIQIGVEDHPQKLHDYQINGVEKRQPKQRVKSINNFRNTNNFQYQQSIKLNLSQANPTVSRRRDEQIKQYMRRLIKPRQHINDQIKDQLKKAKISRQYERHTSRSRMYLATDLRHSKIMGLQTSKQTRFKTQGTLL